VRETWVPPQSSRLKRRRRVPASWRSTGSGLRAVVLAEQVPPRGWHLACGQLLRVHGEVLGDASLTMRSTSASCSEVRGLAQVKSKRRRSGATSEPAWRNVRRRARRRRASLSRWVAVCGRPVVRRFSGHLGPDRHVRAQGLQRAHAVDDQVGWPLGVAHPRHGLLRVTSSQSRPESPTWPRLRGRTGSRAGSLRRHLPGQLATACPALMSVTTLFLRKLDSPGTPT